MSEERRLVTVLFADVTGSTSLGETLDPEDVSALLGRFFAIAREAIQSHGGSVEKFIGDAVMAAFGLPVAHGDDAERAAAAAILIRDRVRADAALRDRLAIRLGLNTGEVVVTRDPGDDDESNLALGSGARITGDAVNVAARLQQAAATWGILAGERTARAAAGFAFGPLIDVEAKGKAVPVRARELLGRATHVARHLPLVGREADLEQLELVARRAFRERRPYLVSVVAPAGTGKTRLIEEFLDQLPGLEPRAAVAVSQCLPYGQRLTYWPLRAMLFRLAAIDEDAAPDSVRRGLVQWLRRLRAEDPARTAEALAATIGASDAESIDPNGLLAAWRTTIELAAAESPIVLVFEDLHWSSDSLLDLVDYVIQSRNDLPLVIVAMTRPELLDRRPSFGSGRRNHVSLDLEPLDDASIGALVRNLLESAPGTLVEAVVRRADGNPFYAGEIVRSILDRVGEGGVRAADVAQLVRTLPDTVQATVLARLDELPAAARRTLQIGSVFGRAFRPAGIAAVAGEDLDELASALDLLVERDLVRPSGADGYAFRHILIREISYQTLPRADRARLHAAAARWLEARSGANEEAFTELIAYHWREAASLSNVLGAGAEPALAERAEAWLGRAADVALAAGAVQEAHLHLLGALDFTPPERLPELWVRIGQSASTGGVAIPALLRALELAADRRPAGWRLNTIADLLMWQMRFHGAIPEAARLTNAAVEALVAEGIALLQQTDDRHAVAHFLTTQAFGVFYRNSTSVPSTDAFLSQTRTYAAQALELARELDDPILISAALDGSTSIQQWSGDYEGALRASRERVALGSRLDLRELVDAQCMVVWSEVVLGDLHEAIRDSREALAALRPGQVAGWALHLCSWLMCASALAGEWDETLATADRARQLWIELDRAPAGYAGQGLLSAVRVARARRDNRRLDDLNEMVDEIAAGFTSSRRWALYDDIRRGVATADPEALLESARTGGSALERWLDQANDLGSVPPRTDLETLLAEARRLHALPLELQVLRALGLSTDDIPTLESARAIAARIGATPVIGRLECEIGMRLGDRARLAAGREVLRKLGDLAALDRYELN